MNEPISIGGPLYPKDLIETSAGGFGPRTVTKSYLDTYDAGLQYLRRVPPAGTPHPQDSAFKVASFNAKRVGRKVSVTVTYEQTEDSDFGTVEPEAVPPNRVVWLGNSMEVDIRRHPDFSTASSEFGGDSLADLYDYEQQRVGQDAPENYRGMSSYYVASFQVSVTEFTVGNPSSFASLLCTRSAPPGFGSASNWLVLTGNATMPGDSGPFGTRTLLYQYSALPWPALFYD